MMLYPHCVEDDARSAQEALRAAVEAAERSAREREESQTLADAADASYANTTVGAGTGGGKPLVGILKSGPAAKKPKPKLTAKERKERSVRASSLPKSPILVTFLPGLKMSIDKAVTSLPLEFRGQDPVGIFIDLHHNVLSCGNRTFDVTLKLLSKRSWTNRQALKVMNSPKKNAGIVQLIHCLVQQMVKPPDLNQARVNKCLIALVNRKIVRKDTSSVCLNRNDQRNADFDYYYTGSCCLCLEWITVVTSHRSKNACDLTRESSPLYLRSKQKKQNVASYICIDLLLCGIHTLLCRKSSDHNV